jgi:hypothetical protein
MMNSPKNFAEHFFSKTEVLLRPEWQKPFLIGDSPLALQNSYDIGPYGNLGLTVPGIEIYFSLSPTRALGLWYPSHEKMIREGVQRLRSLSQVTPH